MHFIPCSHCNELVEVKSEYMVFCPRCQNKLDNSFTAWRASHPSATFADYLAQVCVSSTAIQGVSEQRRIGRSIDRKRSAKRWMISLSIALGTVLVGLLVYGLLDRIPRGTSIEALLERPWKIAYYDDLGASVKFPYPLETEEAHLPDTLGNAADSIPQIVETSATRSWSQKETLRIVAARFAFKADFGVDRNKATDQILQSMIYENDLQGFTHFSNDYAVSNLKGRMLAGSYLIGPKPFEFRALIVQRQHQVWYFMVTYPRSKPEGLLVAERLFKGVLISAE